MRTIRQFPFEVTHGEFLLELPKAAELLSVDAQDNGPCLWFLVDNAKPTEQVRFFTAFTGGRLEDWCTKSSLIATLQLRVGTWLVLHIFQAPTL